MNFFPLIGRYSPTSPYSTTAKSCSKIIVGKTFWKSIALPAILYGSNITEFKTEEINKLQRIENSVYRQIMGAPSYSQVASLRGEIGSSLMKTRLTETRIIFYKNLVENNRNELLQRILEEMKASRHKWIKEIEKYVKETGITYEKLKIAKKEELKEIIRKWDTQQWKEEMEKKSSLKIYRKWREAIGGQQEDTCDNREGSRILFKCKTNNLNLNDRKRFKGEDTRCRMCDCECGDLVHFLLWCPVYNEERPKCRELQRPYIENEEEIMGNFLFISDNIEKVKKTIHSFRKIREKSLKEIENETE